MTKVITIKDISKSCGECTACCSGHLHGEAHGHKFYKGRPCFFVKKDGCSIYPDRPESPCQTYKCGYLIHPYFPEWMRPDQSGVIATQRVHTNKETKKQIVYTHLTEYNRPMSGQVLWWFIEKHLSGDLQNLLISMDGGHHRLGVPEFTNLNI